MKKKICCLAVLITCMIAAGCGKKEEPLVTPGATEPGHAQASPTARKEDADHVDQDDAVSQQADVNHSTAVIYGVKDGIVSDFATVKLDYQGNISDNPNEYFEELVEATGDYLGYAVDVEEVYSGKGGITIDFDEDSAPMIHQSLQEPFPTKQSKVEYDSYDQMVIGILDSIHKTIQENNEGKTDIWYTCEDRVLDFPNMKEKINVTLEEPYVPHYDWN